MKTLRAPAVLSALAVLFALQPLGAVVEDDPEVEIPEICGDRELELAEDEVLTERTLWFTGTSPVGNTDGAEDLVDGNASRLRMTDQEPDSPASKVYASQFGNPGVSQNPIHGYWTTPVLQPQQRVVCAEATVFASTRNGNLGIQLWWNHAFLGEGPRAEDVASAAPRTPEAYTVNFGELDFRAYNLLVQVDIVATANASTLLYDSTLHPSHLTYVTVDKLG